MPSAVRCYWLVVAGLVPGETEDSYTRRFELTHDAWASGAKGLEPFLTVEAQANAYALSLQIQSTVARGPNWTTVTFVWM